MSCMGRQDIRETIQGRLSQSPARLSSLSETIRLQRATSADRIYCTAHGRLAEALLQQMGGKIHRSGSDSHARTCANRRSLLSPPIKADVVGPSESDRIPTCVRAATQRTREEMP